MILFHSKELFKAKEVTLNVDCVTGAENSVVCGRIGELHHLWTASYQCLVCVCAADRGQLRPTCARCAGCRAPDSLQPDPTQTINPLIVETQSSSESPGYLSELSYCVPFQINFRIMNMFVISVFQRPATLYRRTKSFRTR